MSFSLRFGPGPTSVRRYLRSEPVKGKKERDESGNPGENRRTLGRHRDGDFGSRLVGRRFDSLPGDIGPRTGRGMVAGGLRRFWTGLD